MGGLGLFNVGFGEMFFILIMAGLFLGPHRIRIVARWLGEMTIKSRNIYREFMRQLNTELDESGQEDIRGALEDIRRLQNEMKDLRREITQAPQEALNETRAAIEEAQGALKDSAESIRDENYFPTENSMMPPPMASSTLATPTTPETPVPTTNGTTANLPKAIDVEDDPA